MINNLYIKATPTTAAVTWGSITGTLSAQTDLQSALDAKQATLVSGTNIKTLNSTSLLGSGNVAVQPTLVSGTNIKTINGTSVLGSGDLVVGGGGGNVVATHILTKPRSLFYYSTSLTQGNLNTATHSANALIPTAFIPAYNLTINTFIVQVTTLAVGGLAKIAIYSDLDGVPHTKLLESANVLTTTTGTKTITGFTFTFTAGTTYWIALVTNTGVAGWRSMNINALMLGPAIAASNSTQVYTSWYINALYASLPATLTTPTDSDLNSNSVPYIIFRAV
ncbi:hypothetical protein UFOVP533_13 [uncultured Caudovirales phage]|uniref:Uncharacterized protein n=1 Tax=uncultured Caudovirales phage TaxID=2100421 RepID=A0A6J5MN96_9CAUD|nr:hypothetical protein UFOVP533_13 [uncultured Caudovirales phage]